MEIFVLYIGQESKTFLFNFNNNLAYKADFFGWSYINIKNKDMNKYNQRILSILLTIILVIVVVLIIGYIAGYFFG